MNASILMNGSKEKDMDLPLFLPTQHTKVEVEVELT
jgi:hypothetical protein